jgi:hypothetical protein
MWGPLTAPLQAQEVNVQPRSLQFVSGLEVNRDQQQQLIAPAGQDLFTDSEGHLSLMMHDQISDQDPNPLIDN